MQNPMSATNVAELLCITPLLLAIRKRTTRRKPSLKGVLLGVREAAPGKSPTHAMSVGKPLFKNQVLQNMSKFMLERDPINVLSVERPLFEGQSSGNIWESTVGGSTSVLSVRMPSQEAPTSFDIRESAVGRVPTSALSEARPSDRGQTLVSPENSW